MTEPAAGDPGGDKRPLRQRLFGDVRTRIIASYVVLLAISGLATVLIVRGALLTRLDDRVDAGLVQEAGEFRRLAGGVDPNTGEPFAGDVDRIFEVFLNRNVPNEGEQLVTVPRSGPPIFRGSPSPPAPELRALTHEWRRLDESMRGEVETEAGTIRYLAVPVTKDGSSVGTFAVANYLERERSEVNEAVSTIGFVAAIILLGGTAVAFLAVGRVLAPLSELRDAARSVSSSDMTQRIAVTGEDELAELGRTFNRMLDRLELAFSTQREFIRDAGHELRTPIAIVRGHLELLAEEEPDDSDRLETFEMLNGELDRMTRFVNDMLLLARAERPDFLQLETIGLGPLCEELLAKASALGDREWAIDSCADATIVGDRQRLTQAVINLADNSVSNSVRGDAIAIGSRIDGAEVQIWVRDEGRGIDAVERETILEPFRRGRGARYEGSGLGLPIVAAIATAHGGSIDIASTLEVGTTVTLTLPIEGPDVQPGSEEQH